MTDQFDLYKVKDRYEYRLRKFEADKKISKANHGAIRKFVYHTAAEGLTLHRQLKYLDHLWSLAKILKKDFVKCNKDDLVSLVGIIHSRDYSPWTKKDYKIALKKFFLAFWVCE